ncbi:MAG: AmmeMemoRadiSam system protein B [Polyangiaceae bacterium]
MLTARSRPRLRPVESIVVPDPRHGRVVVLRDTRGVTDAQAVLPPDLVPIVVRFTGRATCETIATEVSHELGRPVPIDVVVALARELEEALFLEGDTFERALAAAVRAFRESPVRAAAHAGGAYHADADELRRYVDTSCLGASGVRSHGAGPPIVALVAPHIDPWRGAVGYGHAYGALAHALDDAVDTFVVFGTSHAPMEAPFALCKKAFATPFGAMPADDDAIDDLAAACRFDPWADTYNHVREHSIEFQAVFLRHLLGPREARIVPVLAGLGKHQARGTDPARDADVERFFDAVKELRASRPGRVVVVAGADFAHVGPRFGDPNPFDATARKKLERTDRTSLRFAERVDAGAFWDHVARDLDARRVCGLGPVYSMLRSLEGDGALPSGETLHYEQTVDADDGSIVSHAAIAFRDARDGGVP